MERGGTVHLQLKRTRELELFCQELDDFEELLWSLLVIIEGLVCQIVVLSQPISHRVWKPPVAAFFYFALHGTY